VQGLVEVSLSSLIFVYRRCRTTGGRFLFVCSREKCIFSQTLVVCLECIDACVYGARCHIAVAAWGSVLLPDVSIKAKTVSP
jgi:hypothetical protein